MTAEIFGRETGLGRGRGGHMHLFDPATHFSCSGIIAEGYPPALGQAFAFQRKGTDRIAVAVTGEGAANQGAFHESLNLAALWSLPVVFVVEDNDWAHLGAARRRPPRSPSNADRAAAYGIPGERVEDNDVEAVYDAAGRAVARARAGEGPVAASRCTRCGCGATSRATPRATGPSSPRCPAQDPIPRYEQALREAGRARRRRRSRGSRPRRRERVEDAIAFAKDSPLPDPARRPPPTCSPEETTMTITETPTHLRPRQPPAHHLQGHGRGHRAGDGARPVGRSTWARTSAPTAASSAPPPACSTGSGRSGSSTPRSPRPPSSASASARRSRACGPIVELMFADFMGVCLDQIYNHMAKIHFESGGNVKVPMVLTTAVGGGYSDGAQHSQCLWGTFAHLPGMKVVVPSNPADAKGLMTSAIRDDNPVVYMFHKGVMGLPWMAKNPRVDRRGARRRATRCRSARPRVARDGHATSPS